MTKGQLPLSALKISDFTFFLLQFTLYKNWMIQPNNNELSFVVPEGKERRFLWADSWRLAWPVFIGQGVATSMILISRMMVGAIGESALAALGLGQMIFFALVLGLSSIAVGMVALIAREVGAGNIREASRIFGQGVFFGTIASLFLSIAGILLTRPIFLALHIAPEVLDDSVRCMFWLYLGLPFASTSFFLGAGLRGAGDTRTPMVIQILNTCFNILLQYVLVFGKFGLPKMGIVGAGLAMAIAFLLSTIMFIPLFSLSMTKLDINFSKLKIDLAILKKIVKIGGPTAIEWELIQLGLIAFVSIVNRYGPEPAAAYIIGLSILNFSQLPSLGYNASATTQVGMCLGAKRPDLAEMSLRVNITASVILMSVIAIAMVIFAQPLILSLFPQSSELTVGYAKLYLYAVAVCHPLMAIAFVQAGALRGAGYSVSPMIAQSSGMYIFRLGLAVLLWKKFNAPVQWLWLTQIPDFLFRTLYLSISVRRGRWKKVKT